MKIGSYDVSLIETGDYALDGGAMFGVIPYPLWSRKIKPDEKNRTDLRLRSLLLQGEGRVILVDTGMGSKWSEKLKNIYKLDYSRFTLFDSLAEKALKPSDITDVIITHFHFDHSGGNTFQDEREKLIPTFPNATYYIHKENLEWAKNPTEKDKASYIKEDWEPLVTEGVLKIIKNTKEILPGIQMKLFYGHTQGIQLPFLDDGQNKLLFCGDLMPTSTHLGIPWIMSYDNFPLQTIKEKREILKKAVNEKWILAFQHCPLVAAGRVSATEKGFVLESSFSLDLTPL